jgi:hypothetical protein
MRRVVYFLEAFCSLCLVAGFSAATASADTLSVSQTITVTAVVAPARSIIVDQSGQILTILSNTEDPVMPNVYMGTIHGSQQSLTPALQKQYTAILAAHKGSQIGTIYAFQPKPITSIVSLLGHNFSIASRAQVQS